MSRCNFPKDRKLPFNLKNSDYGGIFAREAWKSSDFINVNDVIVAVIDSGVTSAHLPRLEKSYLCRARL